MNIISITTIAATPAKAPRQPIGTLYTATLAAGKAVLKQVPQDDTLAAPARNAPQSAP